MTLPDWGVYVHVPWCRIRCPYCAFYVVPDRGDAPWSAYVQRVLLEHQTRRADFPDTPRTIYLGGGTPSRLPVEALTTLLKGLQAETATEVTVEVNPEDLTAAWLDAASQAGVTRVSLGVQTLNTAQARRLGRAHTPVEAKAAMHLITESSLQSWSADLMFALHEQTPEQLAEDLDTLLTFDPPHVSIYGLTIEPGTPYERATERGLVRPPPEDTWRALYTELVSTLDQAGRHRYEVSNFAKAGHRSQHNQLYWRDRPYMGLGPAAHGYAPSGARWSNIADLDAYLECTDPTDELEHPRGEARAVDLLISGLRGVDGLSIAHLVATSGMIPAPEVRRRLVDAHLLQEADGRMMLATEGFYVADGVVRELAAHLVPAVNRTSFKSSDPLNTPPF